MDILNGIIWGLQIYLAYWFFKPALMKLQAPQEKLAQMGLIKSDGNPLPIRILGCLELSGIIAITVLPLFKIAPILTPLAALGLGIVMLGAFIFHVKKKQYEPLTKIGLAFVFCMLVAWYRFDVLGYFSC